MASYEPNPDKLSRSKCVNIDTYELIDNITLYHIRITIGEYWWIVKHRYSEFYELNEKLVAENSLDRSLLPPKKLFGNQSENFLQKRKSELENYLQILTSFDSLSRHVCTFLDFHKYEIHGITQSLAEELFYQGDALLQSGELYPMTPVQLHALTERLKLPIPTCDSGDKRKDIGHILDFLSRIQTLLICGSNKPVGTSNIVPNKLSFDLGPLKNLQLLKLDGCDPQMIRGLLNVRKTVSRLQVQESMRNIKDLLLCDVLHWDPCFSPPTSAWNSVIFADFSYNHLTAIDNSIWLLPQVEILDLSHNQISDVNYLDHLTHLNNVDFSFNCFTMIPSLHTRLGNIVTLNFAGNAIEFLQGFSKLYSLVHLDLHSNKINSISEILHLASLPCLENLNLTGNPLTTIIDYRTRVLEQFNRASEICLDNEPPTQKELDTVAILQALRRAKEIGKSSSSNCTVSHKKKEPNINQSNETSAASHSGRRVKTPKNPSCSSTNNVTDFRQYVESIRAQGGVGWLRLWNQCLKESKHTAFDTECSPNTSKRRETAKHKCKSQGINSEVDEMIANKTCTEISNSSPFQATNGTIETLVISNERIKNIETHLISMSRRDYILPEWLPTFSNKLFFSYVESLVKSSSTSVGNVIDQTSQCVASSFLPLPFWTIGIYFLKSLKHYVFPACLVGTHDCILVFSLVDIQQDGSPNLSLIKCFKLGSFSKISVGRYHHYLRLEIKGENAFYIFKFPSRNFCAQFLNYVQLKYQEQVKIPLNITYRELKMLSLDLNESFNLLHETVSYNWIAVDTPVEIKKGYIPCIAITKGTVYLIQEQFTNSVSPDSKEFSTINILQKWDIVEQVKDLSLLNPVMNVVNALARDERNTTDINKNSERAQDCITKQLKNILRTSGFGVVLHLKNSTGLAVRFPSSESRDEFLEVFTKERFSCKLKAN